jgi:hypothetical protein
MPGPDPHDDTTVDYEQFEKAQLAQDRNDVTFVLPERVYEELTVDDPDIEDVPVDTAIDEGRKTVAAPLEFSEHREGPTPAYKRISALP